MTDVMDFHDTFRLTWLASTAKHLFLLTKQVKN
jgi:hypothetical protein